MKIALHPTSEVGIKAGRLLVGERDLETLGILGHEVIDRDSRVRRIDDFSGFDVLVTDDPDPGIAEEAIAAGVPVVTWVDGDHLDLTNIEVAVMTGANLATGIAGALAAREAAGEPAAILVAWTEPGKTLGTGEPVTFPDPVGARWGRIRSRRGAMTDVVVPVPDEWAGAVVRVTDEGTTRILGIADLASHLESLALTAGAVTLAGGSHRPGRLLPGDVADDYLLAALKAGLDVASFTAAA